MKPYKSKSGKKSGVVAYETGLDFIVVQFSHGDVYSYTYQSAGKATVEKMKKLALAQKGLSTFIAQEQPGFEKR